MHGILDGGPEHPTSRLVALAFSRVYFDASREHFPSFGHRPLGTDGNYATLYLAGLISPPKRLTALGI